jgi:hypothetical protein
MAMHKLKKNKAGNYKCPKCGRALDYQAGGAVQIVDGRVDFEVTKPRYICYTCQISLKELVIGSGVYESTPLLDTATAAIWESMQNAQGQDKARKKKELVPTGELESTKLEADASGHCACPRCGEQMDFIEGGPVKIVDGKPDFSDTFGHFVCSFCDSVFRKVAGTEYYQWCEK